MLEQCAKFGDFIVVRDIIENPDWLGKVFCIETATADPFDPFGGCFPPNEPKDIFYHYVASKHVGRISARNAECIIDECRLLVLEASSRAWWGRWLVPCGRAEFIEKSEEWAVWSAAGCLNRDFKPPGFEQEAGGLIGGCGGDPKCCPPACV